MTAARIEKLRTALRRIDDSPERSRLIATSALVIDDRAAEDDKEKECETSKTPWKTEHCASSSSASLSSARASSGLGESHEEIANRVWNDWPESLAHMPKYAVAVHEEIVRCQSGEGSSAVSGNYSSADTTSTNGPTSGRSTSKASPSPGRSLSRPSQTDASSAASPADLPAELEARLWSAIRWNVTPDLMMRLRSAVAPLAADLAAAVKVVEAARPFYDIIIIRDAIQAYDAAKAEEERCSVNADTTRPIIPPVRGGAASSTEQPSVAASSSAPPLTLRERLNDLTRHPTHTWREMQAARLTLARVEVIARKMAPVIAEDDSYMMDAFMKVLAAARKELA